MDGARRIADESDLYERDYMAWLDEQARLLRAGDWAAVDAAHLIEEVESLGASERNALASRIAVILEHLIKLDHSVEDWPRRGWQHTVDRERDRIARTLEDMPSLRRLVPEMIEREYPRARREAMRSFAEYEPERLGHYERTVSVECAYLTVDMIKLQHG